MNNPTIGKWHTTVGGREVVVLGSATESEWAVHDGRRSMRLPKGEELTVVARPLAVREALEFAPPLTIGADPEIFAFKNGGDYGGVCDRVVPAWLYLPSKRDARGGPFWDGVQAEFVTPPTTRVDAMLASVKQGLREVGAALAKSSTNSYLASSGTAEVQATMLDEAPPSCVALGCDPSENAYGIRAPRLADDPATILVRTAGAHMHFGIKHWDYEPRVLVEALDRIAGVCMTSMLAPFEDARRRQYYGLPGEFRLPKHGLEWRTPSSEVLWAPAVLDIMWEVARAALRLALVGMADSWYAPKAEAVKVVSACNHMDARALVLRNRELLEEMLVPAYGVWGARIAVQVVADGLSRHFRGEGVRGAAISKSWGTRDDEPPMGFVEWAVINKEVWARTVHGEEQLT